MATISPPYPTETTHPASSPFDTDSVRDRYAENVYFQDGAVFTGILTSLLYLILATSLDAASYVAHMTILVPVVFGALGLAFLMVFSRFDGFFALSHSLFTCLAWILFLMTSVVSDAEIRPFLDNGIPELQAKAYFVLLRWLNWIDAAINGVASEDNYIFIFEMAFLVWWLTYLGVWSIFRYGYTWRAIIPAGVVLLINVYYAPSPILGFLVVFCLVAILLFVRTHLAEQQLRWREQRIYYSQDITLDFLRNGLMYAVVVLALAWIAPGLGRSLQVRSVLAPINDRWQETSERWSQLYQGVNRQLQPGSAGFGRSLSLGGERNVGNSFVFRVSAPIGRYWRAVVYDTYTGRQWLNTFENEVEIDAGENASVGNWAMRSPMTQTVTLMAPSGNVIFSAPDIVRVDVPITAVTNPLTEFGALDEDGEWDGPVEITWARTQQMMDSGDSYRVVANYSQTTVRALDGASSDYPQEIVDTYLQLPENSSARVAAHALELTEEHDTVYAKAKAIEAFLRTYTYNDIISAPPPEVDPVEYFLYDIQEGYCDYYATSMAVMLRSVGIPARVVSGYAEGIFDEEMQQYFISERDAHSWVEVYFPGYGWVEFEPTAGVNPLDRPLGEDPFETDIFAEPAYMNPSDGSLPGEDFMGLEDEFPFPEWQQDELFALEAGSEQGRGWLPWALLTPVLLVVGGWFIWRTRLNAPTQFDPELPPILFERLQRWATRLGLLPAATQTPYEQAVRFSRAMPEGKQSIDAITDGYVRYRFSRNHHSQAVHPAGHGDGLADGSSSVAPVRTGLLSDWQTLQPMLWRAWLHKIFRTSKRRENEAYTLRPEGEARTPRQR